MCTGMKEALVRYAGWSAAVGSDDASDLAWLREFLSPAFEFGAGESGCRFILQADVEAVGVGRALTATSQGQLTAFILDSGVERLPCQRGSGQGVLAYDRVFDAVYRKEGETTLVLDVPSPGPGRRARGGLMRAIRESAMDHVWRTGGSFLHAAAFALGDKAVVVGGDKGAGKSTMLCAALMGLRGAVFLANDRLTLRRSGSLVRARGMPSIVSIRDGSLGIVPGLAECFSGIGHDYTGTPVSGETMAHRRTLAPLQFANALGAEMTREASVACILLPVIEPQEPGFRLRRLGGMESAQRVLGSAFARRSLGVRSELFSAPDPAGVFPTREQLVSRLSEDTSGIPCFEAVIGSGIYQRDGMQRLVDAVFSRL